MTYRFEAIAENGEIVKGLFAGSNAPGVRSALRRKGMVPLSVEAVREKSSWTILKFAWKPKEISTTALAVITRQFSTLLRSGLPVDGALAALARQAPSPRARAVLDRVRDRVREGQSLATALGEFPRSFPDLYRRLIEAGEQSGCLDDVLERLADYNERALALRQKVTLAMIYPALLVMVALGVVSALLVSVVPQVTRVFANSGQKLPAATRALMAMSGTIRNHGALTFFAIAALVTIASFAIRAARRDENGQRLELSLPLWGRLVSGINTTRFASTLGILTASGVPLASALSSAARVVTHPLIQSAVNGALANVLEGRGFASSLEEARCFPPMFVQLVASGEASGKLPALLERAADVQRRELETTVAALTAVLEPALILVMGGLVLFIVLAILTPIVQMNQLIR